MDQQAFTVADVSVTLGDIPWRKSRASNPQGNCVELAAMPDGGVAVRHSRAPGGPALIYSRGEVRAFLDGLHAGEFDDLLRDGRD